MIVRDSSIRSFQNKSSNCHYDFFPVILKHMSCNLKCKATEKKYFQVLFLEFHYIFKKPYVCRILPFQ